MEPRLRRLCQLIDRLKDARRTVAFWSGGFQEYDRAEAEDAPRKLRLAELALLDFLTCEDPINVVSMS